MKPPFNMKPKEAIILATFLITHKGLKANTLMTQLVKLTPTASVLRDVLKLYYPFPHPIYKSSAYRMWLRNLPLDRPRSGMRSYRH
jgi:hypothetical protein